MTAITTSLPLAVIAGLALGFAGGAGHLAVTWWRAKLLPSRGAAAVLLTFPLALAAPLLAVLAAAWVAPAAAWASPAGILLARAVLLRRMGGAK